MGIDDGNLNTKKTKKSAKEKLLESSSLQDSRDKSFSCPCCKACQDCTVFQTILDLQDKGLVIYRRPKRIEDQTTATGDVFILRNTTNIEIKTSDFVSEIEKHGVSCPRCRHIMRHAMKLLQSVPTIDKKDIVGICDHCRKKAKSHRISCDSCDEIVKMFVNGLDDFNETHGKYKRYVKSETSGLSTTKKSLGLYASHEGLSLMKKHSAEENHDPEIERILLSGPRKSSVDEGGALERSNSPLIDISWLSRPRVEKPKINESIKSPKDLKFSKNKQEFANLYRKSYSDELLNQSILEIYTPQHIKSKTSSLQEIPIKSIKPILLEHHDEKTKSSTNHGIIPVDEVSKEHFEFQKEVIEDTSHKYFKYVFPRAQRKTKKSTISHVSSAKLIKDTHNKLRVKAEMEKKKQEELQDKNKEEKEKKILAKEEKKRISGKGSVSSTIKLRPDKDDNRQQKETNKFSSKIDRQMEGRQQKYDDEKQRDKEGKLLQTNNDDKYQKQFIKRDEKQQRREDKPQQDKDDIHNAQKEMERKQEKDKGKDQSQKDKDGIHANNKGETQKIIEEKLHGENKMQRGKDQKPLGEAEETHKDRREGKASKETQMQKDEKGKLSKESQTEKSKKEGVSTEKESKGKHEKFIGKGDKEEQDKSTGKENKEKQEKSMGIEDKEKQEKSKQKDRKFSADQVVSSKQKDMAVADKVLAEALKRQQEHEISKNKQADSLKTARELADKAAKRPGSNIDVSKLLDMKDFPQKPSFAQKSEIEIDKRTVNPLKELKVEEVILKKPSCDDFALNLIKMTKMNDKNAKGKGEKDVTTFLPQFDLHQQQHSLMVAGCRFCDDSDLSLDIGSLTILNRVKDTSEIIRGKNIVKNTPLPKTNTKLEDHPYLFKTVYSVESLSEDQSIHEVVISDSTLSKKTQKVAPNKPDGIIRYALSDRTFIDKGWTLLPTEKVVRKINIYRMLPAQPEFDWFEHNKNKKLQYDTGEALADFNENGRGRWFYRNGRVALDYYDAEDVNAQQRYVVYSSGELDERGHTYPITVLATFDYSGNGVVFDHKGKIRLKYNQTEGVVLDRALGPVSHWKWHSLNDPPQLQQVMIDTHMQHKDPQILKFGEGIEPMLPDNYDEDMVAIEFENFIKEKNKKMTCQNFKPFQIKMKALKINDQFSLRILDQATIYIIYRDRTTNLKLNLGMLLDHKEIVDTDTADVGTISNSLERLPAQTNSILDLQNKIQYAKHVQRLREEHEFRLQPRMAIASVDQLTAGISRPLRPVLLTVPSMSKTAVQEQQCKCSRKPVSNNLYYSTRLV